MGPVLGFVIPILVVLNVVLPVCLLQWLCQPPQVDLFPLQWEFANMPVYVLVRVLSLGVSSSQAGTAAFKRRSLTAYFSILLGGTGYGWCRGLASPFPACIG